MALLRELGDLAMTLCHGRLVYLVPLTTQIISRHTLLRGSFAHLAKVTVTPARSSID